MTPRPSRNAFGRVLYPLRLFAIAACIVMAVIAVREFGRLHWWYPCVLGLALIYPHVSRYLAEHGVRRRRLELQTSLIDAFILGSTIFAVGFSPVPALALATIAFTNGMALGGAAFLLASALSLALGIAIPALLFGLDVAPRRLPELDLIAALTLLAYFVAFARIAYRRAVLLQKSRLDARQQTSVIEIEKRKFESLLQALVPGSLAASMERGEAIPTRRHEQATILVADVAGFSAMVDGPEYGDMLQELNHCFRAFDQVAARRGLEPMRTVGDCYIAVAGVTSPSASHAADAVDMALEMVAFADEHGESRRSLGKRAFDFRFVVHSGPLVSGLVQTRRFTFDVWGSTVAHAMNMRQLAQAGSVTVSSTTARLLDGAFALRTLGSVRDEHSGDMAVYTLGRPASA
ncbi:MAG: adenylate/guanylate cyclase domain-containing protein [Gammaproteobacteria bacterium]